MDDRQPDMIRLTLDRPDQANTIVAEVADALFAAFDRATAQGTRVLILSVNGRDFSGGFNPEVIGRFGRQLSIPLPR